MKVVRGVVDCASGDSTKHVLLLISRDRFLSLAWASDLSLSLASGASAAVSLSGASSQDECADNRGWISIGSDAVE